MSAAGNNEKQNVDSDPPDSALNLELSERSAFLDFHGGQSYQGRKALITGLGNDS